MELSVPRGFRADQSIINRQKEEDRMREACAYDNKMKNLGIYSGWFEKNQLGILHTRLGNKTISLVLPFSTLLFGKGVHHTETDVVACSHILMTYVSKTYNQELHTIINPFGLLLPKPIEQPHINDK